MAMVSGRDGKPRAISLETVPAASGAGVRGRRSAELDRLLAHEGMTGRPDNVDEKTWNEFVELQHWPRPSARKADG
jgi:hypothetical protein